MRRHSGHSGAIIAAIFPLVLAAAFGPGWSIVLWTAALFLVVEPIFGHGTEPLPYGHSSGLSPVAVVASATFWTWLWGPIGLVLATPLLYGSERAASRQLRLFSKEDRTHGRRRRWAVFDPPRMIHLGHRWRNPDLRRAVLYLLGLLLAFTGLC